MTGEKLRSLRRDHKPSKEDGDLLAAGEDEAAAAPGGAFTGGKGGRAGGHRGPGAHRHRPPARAAPAGPERGPFPVHECVFKGDVRRLSALIRTQGIAQKDSHVPLQLSWIPSGPARGSELSLDPSPLQVNIPSSPSLFIELEMESAWSDEMFHCIAGFKASNKTSVVAQQREFMVNSCAVSALLRKLKQQSRESVEEKRPRLLKALKELGDFYLELHWDFQSWVPLLSRILPSDACKIHKQGINIRLDTTLIDFTDMKCQRGDLSFIFNGDAAPSESFVVLDNEQKVYQRIHHEESEMETEEEVDILMSSDIYSATLSTKSITFTRAQTGWLFREDKTERVGNFLADFYLVNGLVLESRKRREHLSEEDILRNKAIMESLSKGGNLMEQNFEPVRRQSLTPPSPNTISWEEYISAESGKAPHLGRELVCKESKKTFKATIAMSQEFPLGIESLLNVLEVIAPFKHFNKLREFVQMKLPPGFPVKLDIPVFPTITATVTFQEFRYDEFHDSIFSIPDDYKEDPSRFPDL
ncbi:Ankyrin repeat domain-containing protein 13C [Turdus rufiventris]|nr:Ankyrin repeat domain-containing protein 13C [Turdus rufiventris]